MKKLNKIKKYYIDFYDMIDGWIYGSTSNPELTYDDIEEAKKKCIELHSGLSTSNIRAGEHYGVKDSLTNKEVYCLEYKYINTEK
jgi:hypothetical protein